MNLNAIIRTTKGDISKDKTGTFIIFDGEEIEIGHEKLLEGVPDRAEVILQVSADCNDVAYIVFVEGRDDNSTRKLRINDNCLQGLRCPTCGSLSRFRIAVKTALVFDDGGTDDQACGGYEWNDDSYCGCSECGCHLDIRQFKDEAFYREVEELHRKYRPT